MVSTANLPTNARTAHRNWPAWSTMAWALVFGAFHCYWFLGGRFGLGTLYDQAFQYPWFVAGDLAVAGLCLIGAVLCQATVQSWGRALPSWLIHASVWLTAGLLVLRGVAGLADDISGPTFPIGQNTALNYWSGVAVDSYFCLGGILFVRTALAFARRSR